MLGSLLASTLVLAADARPAEAQAATQAEPFARANRLAISFGFGLGSAAMSRQHDFAADATGWLKARHSARG